MHPKSKRTKSGIDLDLKQQKYELQCTNITRSFKPVFNPEGVGGRKAWTAASSSSCQLSSSTAQVLEILRVEEPDKRQSGIMLKTVDELVDKLKNEAKVI